MTTTKKLGLTRAKMISILGTTRPASPTEAFLGMSMKLFEEVSEVVRAPEDIEEYGDVLQTLQDFAKLNGIKWSDVLHSRQDKYEVKGGYLPPTLWTRNK